MNNVNGLFSFLFYTMIYCSKIDSVIRGKWRIIKSTDGKILRNFKFFSNREFINKFKIINTKRNIEKKKTGKKTDCDHW